MTYLQLEGADLYCAVAGQGEPVLLLHGGFCSLESFRAVSDALVEDFQVHAFERPGHGRSPDVDGPFSYPGGVSQALAYLEANDLDRVHVIGYSDGAILGLLLALDHPARVRSLVAISGNLDPSAFTHSPEANAFPVLAPLDAPGGDGEESPDVERQVYDRLSPDGPAHAEVILQKLFALWTSEPHIDATELARVTAPTLVMSGDRDTIRIDHSALIAASISGAQLCIVPGATHALVAERPQLVSAVIRGFLEGLSSG